MQVFQDFNNEQVKRLPEHLRKYIVDQEYEHYTPVDHALWRYVMRQNYSYLKNVAYYPYIKGLEIAGLSIESIPDLQKMAVAYMPLGTADELRQQIIEVALDRAFLMDPLPSDELSFKKRIDEGRGRLTLIANEVARLAGVILIEFAAATRKIKDTKNAPEATADCAQQLQRLVPKRFLALSPWTQLQHYVRYLKAIVLRLDKWRADPARDAAKLLELKPQEQRYWRLVAERKGAVDDRMLEFRWLLEELRVSFFAQELRTPQPVSVKRLDKAWTQLNH